MNLILLPIGLGFLWMGLEWVSSRGHIHAEFSLWFSLVPIALALVVGVRRIWFERFLLLDQDSMILPIGFFGMRTAKIEYTRITRVWQQYIRPYEYRFVLKVATEEQVFSIIPGFLPDDESYRTLQEFLNRNFHENTRSKTALGTTC